MAAYIIWQLSAQRQTFTVIKDQVWTQKWGCCREIKNLFVLINKKEVTSSIINIWQYKWGVRIGRIKVGVKYWTRPNFEETHRWGRRGRRWGRTAPPHTAGWRLPPRGSRPAWWWVRPPCRWWCESSEPSSSPNRKPTKPQTQNTWKTRSNKDRDLLK